MYQIVSDNLTGKITISDKFDITAATASADFTPTFYQEGDEYILSFIDLQNVKKFTKFFYDGLGITEGRYLLQYYRISRDGQMWSQWYDLLRNIENFPIVDSKETLYIDIKWVRKGYSKVGTIRILEYIIEGDIERDESDLSDLISIPSGSLKIISSPFIYKVFRVQSYEIISPTGIDGCELKYRY